MLSEIQFSDWLARYRINQATRAIISRIRANEPTRSVQDGKSNVTGRYPSQKMGHTIQFESHKVELAFIREYEFDDNVLEYYDQPEPIKVSYRTDSGRRVTTLTTPDFFVMRNDASQRRIWKAYHRSRNGSSVMKRVNGDVRQARSTPISLV